MDMDINEIVKLAAEAGATAAMENMANEKKREKKERNDRRLRNTKLLLSNYRELKSYSEKAVISASQTEELVDILDLMWDPHNRSDQVVESIKKSAIRTKIMMAHIDAMMNVYQELCSKSYNPAELRHYRVLYDTYFADEKVSAGEIAERYGIEKRTVYMDLNNAIDKMSKLLFGIDIIKM